MLSNTTGGRQQQNDQFKKQADTIRPNNVSTSILTSNIKVTSTFKGANQVADEIRPAVTSKGAELGAESGAVEEAIAHLKHHATARGDQKSNGLDKDKADGPEALQNGLKQPKNLAVGALLGAEEQEQNIKIAPYLSQRNSVAQAHRSAQPRGQRNNIPFPNRGIEAGIEEPEMVAQSTGFPRLYRPQANPQGPNQDLNVDQLEQRISGRAPAAKQEAKQTLATANHPSVVPHLEGFSLFEEGAKPVQHVDLQYALRARRGEDRDATYKIEQYLSSGKAAA